MQFEFSDPQTEFEKVLGGHYFIHAFGKIEAGDGRKFQDFLGRSLPPPRTEVYIDSSGGDVDAAIEIGRLVRSSWFSTSVGAYLLDPEGAREFIQSRRLLPGKCLSAATLVYLGGRLRHFPEGSKFGVHQFSFRDPSPEHIGLSQVLSARIARFVADMGISHDFLELSSTTPDTSILLIGKEQLRSMGVITGGETDVEWTLQARNQNLYVRGERDSIFGHHKVMLGYARGADFYFWAVIEALGREQELTEFGLVEIVINGEDVRIDISDRCLRTVRGIYVNVFAKITQEEAKLLAYSDSFGVQIRVSHEAPVFFGISAVSTEGGKDQLESFFNTLYKE